MPELPEVETIIRQLHTKVPGRKVASLEVNLDKWKRQLRQDNLNPDKDVVGHFVCSVGRIIYSHRLKREFVKKRLRWVGIFLTDERLAIEFAPLGN